MTGSQEDLEAGVSAYREACRDALTYDLEVALNAALDWGDWAGGRASWAEASTAYALAFEAADRLWRHQLGRTEKEIWLGTAQRLGERVGLAAARAGQLDRAAVFMERGRAQLLAESLSLGQLDLAWLAAVDPDLAGRYTAAADRLRNLDAAARDERSGHPLLGHSALWSIASPLLTTLTLKHHFVPATDEALDLLGFPSDDNEDRAMEDGRDA